MISLKVKTKTGLVTDMQVEALLEVDGKPYQSADDLTAVREAQIHLEGRVDGLENVLNSLLTQRTA